MAIPVARSSSRRAVTRAKGSVGGSTVGAVGFDIVGKEILGVAGAGIGSSEA